jgi:hypothetical protein
MFRAEVEPMPENPPDRVPHTGLYKVVIYEGQRFVRTESDSIAYSQANRIAKDLNARFSVKVRQSKRSGKMSERSSRGYGFTLFVVLLSLMFPSVLFAQRKKPSKRKLLQRPTVAQALQSFRSTGIAWIIPASYVIKLLEKNNVPISK